MLVNRAAAQHVFPVQHAIPILAPVNQDQVAPLQFAGLHQGEHFPELVHCAVAAGKNNQRLGKLREPQLAHEKIMEHKAQLRADVVIRTLFVRQLNAQADGLSAGLGGAEIGRLHDSRPAPRADDEPARIVAERHGPGCNAPRQLARLLVIAGHLERRLGVAQGGTTLRRVAAFRTFSRRARACSRESIRAEPNITMVSPTFSRRRRSSGSMYSVRIRTGRAGKLSINTASRYGGSISTLLCLLRGRRLMKPPLQNGCGHYLFTLNPEGEPAKISYGSTFYAPAASKRQQHGLILCGVCTGELPRTANARERFRLQRSRLEA